MPIILMVDDDDEDIYLTQRAFCAQRQDLQFRSVQSYEDLFDYLHSRGEYQNNSLSDLPDVIILDINIPKKNGFEILESLRSDHQHGHIPVVMLTTSSAKHDVQEAYRLGANSYISKTVNAEGMKEVAMKFCSYWFDFSKLPAM